MPIYHTSDPLTSNIYADVDYIKKSMLGFDFTDVDDESLLLIAEAASRSIDDYTNNIFFQEQIINEKHTSIVDKDLRIFVRTNYKPIIAVSEIFLETVPTQQVKLDPSYLDIHPEKGIIYAYASVSATVGTRLDLRRFAYGEGMNVVLNYTAGPLVVPAPIKRATALLVRNMLRPGQLSSGIGLIEAFNTGGLKRVQSKSYEEEYDTMNTGAPSMKMSVASQSDFLFTSDVKALLMPYLKRGVL